MTFRIVWASVFAACVITNATGSHAADMKVFGGASACEIKAMQGPEAPGQPWVADAKWQEANAKVILRCADVSTIHQRDDVLSATSGFSLAAFDYGCARRFSDVERVADLMRAAYLRAGRLSPAEMKNRQNNLATIAWARQGGCLK